MGLETIAQEDCELHLKMPKTGGPRSREHRRGPRPLGAAGAALVVALAGGCATDLNAPPFPEPLRPPLPAPAETSADDAHKSLRATPTPGVVVQETVADRLADDLGADLTGPPIAVSFHELPLAGFINEVFAKQLGLSFHIAPSLQGREDLVTLKLTEPVSPSQLFATARAVLADYGVDIGQSEGALAFVARPEGAGEVSLLVTGRTLPEVPASHRTIFQLVPLRAATGLLVADILEDMLGDALHVDHSPETHVVTLRGPARLVAQANELIAVLDQPLLEGRSGVVISPSASEVELLAKDLVDILTAEGYRAKLGVGQRSAPVALLPLSSANKLVVFASDQADLAHIEQWARMLDDERRETVEDGVFIHVARNTQAASIAQTLGGLYDEGSLIVDNSRNVLLFRGTGRDWGRLRPIIDELDKPVPAVLVEVLIAEITLADERRSGVEFFLRGALGDKTYKGGTVGRLLGGRTGGIGITLNSGGQVRAVLNAFREDSRVVVRSRPSLVVKSGAVATLAAGNTIPTVSQRVDSATNIEGASNILQQVEYRKTGVNLEIAPVVQANGLVDVTVRQKLSEARPTAATSQQGTPTILERELTTSMTLRDGASVLLGGLIADSRSGGQTGVPWLGKLPGLGRLFRVDTSQRDRTELLVLVTPYVIADHAAGRELTERMRDALRLHNGLP